MNNIEITTTQNVTIEYKLSPLIYRVVAFLLDGVVLGFSCFLLALFVELVFGQAADIIMYFSVFPVFFFYSLAFEQLNNGQSLGKMALKLRVIRIDGEKVKFLDYVMRWVFRALDIYGSFGAIAGFGILASSKNQRLGDFLANTVVVRIEKNERMKLQNLLKLNKMREYIPTYPEVVNMSEESMLIVKETLERHQKIKNYAHNKALDFLVQKMEAELQVSAPKNKTAFLKTLLKDYVVLTR